MNIHFLGSFGAGKVLAISTQMNYCCNDIFICRLEQSLDEKKNALLESERSLVSLRKQLQQLESDANRKASMTKGLYVKP